MRFQKGHKFGFKPGQSGNPKGRPPDSFSITAEIKKKLQEYPPDQKKTYLQIMIERILHMAIVEGDEQMLKTVWQYVDGMPSQTIKGDSENPISIICQGINLDKFPRINEKQI